MIELLGEASSVLEIGQILLELLSVGSHVGELEGGPNLKARRLLGWRQRTRELQRFLIARPGLDKSEPLGRQIAGTDRVGISSLQ